MRYERLSQREYAKRLGVSNTAVSNAVKDGLIIRGWDEKEKKIIVAAADREWGDSVRKIPKPALVATMADVINDNAAADGRKVGPSKLTITADADLFEARRVSEVAKAQLVLYELGEKSGRLVDKAQVQKALVEYGLEMKKAFTQIPERTIDSIRAANSRNEALNILDEAIAEVLFRLTDITSNGIDKK